MFWFVLPKGGVNGEESTSPQAVESTRGGLGLAGKSGQQWRTDLRFMLELSHQGLMIALSAAGVGVGVGA